MTGFTSTSSKSLRHTLSLYAHTVSSFKEYTTHAHDIDDLFFHFTLISHFCIPSKHISQLLSHTM